MPRYYCSSAKVAPGASDYHFIYCWADDEKQAREGANTIWRLLDVNATCLFPVKSVVQPLTNEDNEPDFRVNKDA